MKILCLDIATQTGWAIISIDRKIKINYGIIQLAGKDRIVEISNKIKRLLQKYNPSIVLIEDVYLRSVYSFKLLCMLQAGAYLECKKYNKKLRVLKATANSIRKVLKIEAKNRKDIKIEVVKLINTLIGTNIKLDDEADAIAIGIAYINNKDIFSDFKL